MISKELLMQIENYINKNYISPEWFERQREAGVQKYNFCKDLFRGLSKVASSFIIAERGCTLILERRNRNGRDQRQI